METSDALRLQIIGRLLARRTEKAVDTAISLWELLAIQIISIVCEGGFDSLYARSVFLTQQAFPWLTVNAPSPQTDHRFAALKTSFDGQTSAQVSEANSLLLITFTGILASLIGEQLTVSILRSAWGNDASDTASKEFENE